MQLNTLKLQNWRNHQNYRFEFNGVTLLAGQNASGKTNFLESIYYLACGRSFRTKDENLVSWDADFTRIECDIQKENDQEELAVIIETKPRVQKTVKIKEQKVPSAKLLGHLNCVLFTPEEIELIYTLPEARRRYLNLIISQSDVKYAYNLLHFRKTLEQRNSLLKRIAAGFAQPDELEIWDGKLAEYADHIINKRAEYIDEINKHLSKFYRQLSDTKEELAIEYVPSVEAGGGWAAIVTRLAKNRQNDIFARVTSIGPHRDDIVFKLNGKNVTEFASRGEFRTVILALKLSEVEYLEKMTGERPILLLDDVFSELDQVRRDLLSQIFTKQQTVVTTTDLDHVSKNILEKAKVIEL